MDKKADVTVFMVSDDSALGHWPRAIRLSYAQVSSDYVGKTCPSTQTVIAQTGFINLIKIIQLKTG